MLRLENRFNLTRLAPTPSGYLHLGNAYSFILTAEIAKKTGAQILLRIDDLDQERADIAYINDVFSTLNFLGIEWQKGPRDVDDYQQNWSQLRRMDLYQTALNNLAQSGKVFACACSRKQLQTPGYACNCADKNIPLQTSDVAWRVHTEDIVLAMKTLEQGTVKTSLPVEMKNFVVRKKDGYPAYQLTSLLDDDHFGVDLIIRGEDLWPSTIAQLYLARVLDMDAFSKSTFHHHKLLMNDGANKLSKSAGATSVHFLRNQGMSVAGVVEQIDAMFSNDSQN